MDIFKRLTVFVCVIVMSFPLIAQDQSDFEDQLQGLVEDNAVGYVKPLVTSTGIGLNSGVFRTAEVHKLLGFDISVNVSGIQIPDSARYYTFDTQSLGTYQIQQGIDGTQIEVDLSQLYPSITNAPTFFGPSETPEITPDTEYARSTIVSQVADDKGLNEEQVNTMYGSEIDTLLSQNLPTAPVPAGIFDSKYWAVPSIQASLGLPFGTEAQIRYVPPTEIDPEVGNLSLLGIGARISIDQFIPVPFFPLDISAGGFFQNIDMGPVNIKSNIIHAEVSKNFAMLTLYGGVGLESSTLNASYIYEETGTESTEIDLSVKGDNQFRGTLGFRIKMLILAINADYNFGEYNSANVGVGITIR